MIQHCNISPFQPMLVFCRRIKGILGTNVTDNGYKGGWTSVLQFL